MARTTPRKSWVCLAVLLGGCLLSTVTVSAAGATATATASSATSSSAGDECRAEIDMDDASGTTESKMQGQDPDPSNAIIMERMLAGEYESLDPVVLTRSIKALKERGAHRCWHKHSTFLEHLVGVHNILRLWGQGRTIARVGLFHSAYSNSYVNLALFDPAEERQTMKELIGQDAEDLVHLFCIIDRQQVVVNTLLKQGYIPAQGLSVPHLRDSTTQVYLSPETLRMLVVFTMSDIADQYFGWQDMLFGGGGSDGSMIIPGQDLEERHDPTAIWPGVSKPGLWMSYLSQLAAVARTFSPDWRTTEDKDTVQNVGGRLLDVPPVFNNGTDTLSVEDEASARELYWSVIVGQVVDSDTDSNHVIETLEACIRKNPWAFEPRVILAQKLMHRNDFEGVLVTAGQALELQQQWGTAWDKRLSFAAWVSWTRVLYQRAEDKNPWPTNSWAVNNLGVVR
jgi:ribulose bisphosphate carboxylase small subunit